uniref:Uncharacterized protein n=1 Tax=Lepeophtheirus salmonis TaxID=72036 RepID=A0A0K2V4V5_LEPSM
MLQGTIGMLSLQTKQIINKYATCPFYNQIRSRMNTQTMSSKQWPLKLLFSI